MPKPAGLTSSLVVKGMDEFLRELKRADKDFGKKISRVHRETAKYVRERARTAADTRHRTAITSRGDQKRARLVIGPGRRGDSLARFLGMKRRTGWYASSRYNSETARQHRPWVGNQWEPGARNAVPYEIGDAINFAIPEVEEMFWDWVHDVTRDAFPLGGKL